LQRFGTFEWKYRKGLKNVADALSQRDVAGSVWRFCRAAQFQVVGTAGAVAARHREAFQRISIPGQGEDVAGDQGSAKVLTFDLSISLLKRLISGSQSLYRQVQQDAHWASQCQLSVNDHSLVIKWGSRIVVPEDEELRTLLISEFHDSKYAEHFGMSRTRVAVGRLVEVFSRGHRQVCFYLCGMSKKQGSLPQALWTATTVTCSGEALAHGDLRLYCQAS
jgi:hypothetical protein